MTLRGATGVVVIIGVDDVVDNDDDDVGDVGDVEVVAGEVKSEKLTGCCWTDETIWAP
jgi:hypothetical protein